MKLFFEMKTVSVFGQRVSHGKAMKSSGGSGRALIKSTRVKYFEIKISNSSVVQVRFWLIQVRSIVKEFRKPQAKSNPNV